MSGDRVRRFFRTASVREALRPERLRTRARRNPYLTGVLVVAAVLLYVGIWRVEPHQMIPDEVGAVAQPFTLVEGRPGLTTFEKGGNLHIWLLLIAYIPVLLGIGGYWFVTGQFDRNLENAQEVAKYEDGTQWGIANDAVIDAWTALVTAGRFVTATAGLLAVLGVALLARRLHGRPAGVFAAATLTVSLGFTLTAKYATEDVIAGCLLVWTLVPMAIHVDSGEDRPLLFSAGVAGLAISSKATTGILAIPIAYLAFRRYDLDELPTKRAIRELARYPAAAIITYVATTPSLLINPDLYVAELARYGSVRAGDATFYAHPDPGPVAHVGHLATALGAPLLALSAVAVLGVALLTATGRLHRFTWIPLGIAGLYYAIISSWGNIQYNRALLLLPLLALFVGLAAGWATDVERPRLRRVAGPIVAIVLLLSLFYTASGAMVWSTSRADATDWAHGTYEDGDEVVALGQRTYLPEFPDGVTIDRTVVDPMYDKHTDDAKQRQLALVRCNRAEHLVLTSFHYQRYFEDRSVAPNVSAFYTSLLAEEAGYRIVASFGPDEPNLRGDTDARLERSLRLEPPARNTNNPRIVFMERTGEPAADCPALDS